MRAGWSRSHRGVKGQKRFSAPFFTQKRDRKGFLPLVTGAELGNAAVVFEIVKATLLQMAFEKVDFSYRGNGRGDGAQYAGPQ